MGLYLQFFGLSEAPFSITPDPAFVYLSAAHRDALAHLLYGVGQGGAGGFVQLTGEVGTGKTTLCRCLLEQVPDDARIALILNPLQTPRELLASICEELGIETGDIDASSKQLVDALTDYLLKQHALGRRVVVVIDEAQNLSPEALEQVRLLTNLETAKHKLLQMVLLGQPELRALLQRQNLRQLAQRITARYHLVPLGQKETFAYVRHRMKVAGSQRNPFKSSALRTLYRRSAGVPRLINIIADRALSAAYAKESNSVTAAMVHAAASEVQPSEARVQSARWPWALATASLFAVAALIISGVGTSWFGATGSPSVEGPPEMEMSGLSAARESEPPSGQAEISAGQETVAVGNTVSLIRAQSPVAAPLDEAWLQAQHAQAWQVMADLWQDSDGRIAIQSACDGIEGTGFSCLLEQGNWLKVKQLGLPVLLVLHLEQNSLLPLRGMTGKELLVGSEEEGRRIARTSLDEFWLGEFLVVWPQAPDWPRQIKRGESGAAVDIVMEMATYADPAWNGAGVFDAGFESWLVVFQRRHGLRDDGIVGPNTLLYLMAPTIVQPRLIIDPDERS
jgi:general secretion pathway protein A